MKFQIKSLVFRIRQEISLYQAVLEDKDTPKIAKLFLWVAIGYALSPIDLIPEFIPVIGYLDDAIILPLFIFIACKFIPKKIIDKHRKELEIDSQEEKQSEKRLYLEKGNKNSLFFSKFLFILNMMDKKRLLIALVIALPLSAFLYFFQTYNRSRASPLSNLSVLISTRPKVGDIFTVPVSLDTGAIETRGIDVILTFDSSALTLISISPIAQSVTSFKGFVPVDSTKTFNSSLVVKNANISGMIKFGAVTFDLKSGTPTSYFKGSTILAGLTFKALKAGTYPLNFSFTNASSTDSNMVSTGNNPSDFLSSVSNADIIIQSSKVYTPDKTSSLVYTPISAASCGLKHSGDANCDGKVDLPDLYVWSAEYPGRYEINSDFNSDLNVNSLDFAIWQNTSGLVSS